ncbi:hypothetical protein DSO57_1021105 [Entomophthora muscae]|uniref:Uncharacterized protein n=1 Tax=Entomophthora muscae TaxID=34485 RepID=A0ACC2UDB1_9FUNG|nr:hypothetical protein DSO57_1021105 [Entomophthora muscae]
MISGRCRMVGMRVEVSGMNHPTHPAFSHEVYSHELDMLVSQDMHGWVQVESEPLPGDLRREKNHMYQVVNGVVNITDGSYFPGGWHQEYRSQLLTIGTACQYNNSIYFMGDIDHPQKVGTSLKHISVKTSKGTSVRESFGEHPPFSWGYSVGCSDHVLYLTGNEDASHAETIYTLDLRSLRWTSHRVPGLTTTTSGCIAFDKGLLFHMLGQKAHTVFQKIQVVNTTTWQKIIDIPAPASPQGSTYLVPLCVMGASLALLILANITYYIYHYRANHNNVLLFPLHSNELWSHDNPHFKDSWSFSSDLVFDSSDTRSNLETRLCSPLTNAYRDLPPLNTSSRSTRRQMIDSSTIAPLSDQNDLKSRASSSLFKSTKF